MSSAARRQRTASRLGPRVLAALLAVRVPGTIAMVATLGATAAAGAALLGTLLLVPHGRIGEAAAIAAALVMLSWLLGAAADRATRVVQRRILADIETSVWSSLVAHPVHFFVSRPLREVLGYASSISMVRRLVGPQSVQAVLSALSIGLMTLVLGVIDPWLAVRAGVVTVGIGAFATQLFHRQQRHDAVVMHQVESAQATLYPALLGRDEVSVYSAQLFVHGQWRDAFTNQKLSDRAGTRCADAATAVLRATPAIFIAVLCPAVIGSGAGVLGIGAMAVIAMQLGNAVTQLVPVIPAAFSLSLAGRRLAPVLDAAPGCAADGVEIPASASDELRLEGITFAFPESARPVLDGVSASVPAGDMVAVIGPSGAGKSTLLQLMLGLARPQKGRVLLGGIDLSRLPEAELRRRAGYVPQTGALLRGTLRDAVRGFRDDVTDDAIVDALGHAGLAELLASLPMGLDSRIGDGRSGFSGGQEQRILIARALVHSPSLLILDEATSALDADTEAEVAHAIAGLRMTRVVVAHRLTTILNADTVLLLRDGCLTEIGSRDPAELAALVSGSPLRPLTSSQRQGVLQ